MLEQTKNAINDLKASGLKRNEFRVQCERLSAGYGDANIVIFCSLSRTLDLLPELVKRFKVIEYVDNGKVRGIHIYTGTPRLITYDLKGV